MNNELNLDFSGGPQSWFDLWHIHADLKGHGNNAWSRRKKSLERLLDTFHQLKLKLRNYPHDFQLWIMIDENSCEADSVYIHTKNPNADNFPIKVKVDNKNTIKSNELKQFVDSLGFDRVRVQTSGGDIYYLFDKAIGVSLV
jgi:hypothetical protein